MSLGHKQLEENPWEVFESVFAVGSTHQATVVKVEGGHATVALPYGLEGTCHSKHLVKQDGTSLEVDSQDDFVVLEFNRNAKRITVSHLRTHEEGPAKTDAPKKPRAAASSGGGSSRMMDEVNANVEKSTFGDLDVLTALKEQMEGGPEEDSAEAKKPAKKAAAKKAAPKKAASKKKEAETSEDTPAEAPAADESATEDAPETDAPSAEENADNKE